MNQTPQQLFDSLVQNAIDFLKQSISDLQTNPKYSVINFYASIELFLKARLMLEHWALIFEEPKEANQEKFKDGNFRSVSLDETLRRLRKIAHVQISDKAELIFNELRVHRNMLIHFFHPKYSDPPDEKVIENIVAEQCKGWLHLYGLLTNNWKKEFENYIEPLDELNKLMLKQRSYLQAKYDSALPAIKKGKERGVAFLNCSSCGFPASRIAENDEPLIKTSCIVCENQEKYLIAPCPICENNIYVYDLGVGVCEHCETEIDINYLISQFENTKFGDTSCVYCDYCEFQIQPTVIQLDYDEWLCLVCLSKHDKAGQCEWCAEFVTGDTDDSFYFGCVMCEGRQGWGKD